MLLERELDRFGVLVRADLEPWRRYADASTAERALLERRRHQIQCDFEELLVVDLSRRRRRFLNLLKVLYNRRRVLCDRAEELWRVASHAASAPITRIEEVVFSNVLLLLRWWCIDVLARRPEDRRLHLDAKAAVKALLKRLDLHIEANLRELLQLNREQVRVALPWVVRQELWRFDADERMRVAVRDLAKDRIKKVELIEQLCIRASCALLNLLDLWSGAELWRTHTNVRAIIDDHAAEVEELQ